MFALARQNISTGLGLCLAALVATAAARAGGAPRPSASSCRAGVERTARLAGIGARGDLVFAEGLTVRIASLRWPDSDASAAAAHGVVSALVGRELVLALCGEPDRWGRTAADVTLPDGGDAGDLAGALIGAGLALADAGEDEALCRPALLQVEATARQRHLGLWAERSVIDAADAPGLSAALGRFVVAEGRVRSVGERRSRTYLNFAPRDAQGLTVTMARRTWRRLAERGIDTAGLRGRRVRAHGVLEAWRGPTVDVAAAEMLEVLDGEQAPRR